MSKVNMDNFSTQMDLMSRNLSSLQQMKLAQRQADMQAFNTLAGVAGKGFDIYGDYANRKQRGQQHQEELDYRRESDELNRQNLHDLEGTRTNEALRGEILAMGEDPTSVDRVLGKPFEDSAANTYSEDALGDMEGVMEMLKDYQSNPMIVAAGIDDRVPKGKEVSKQREFIDALEAGDLNTAARLFVEDTQDSGIEGTWEGGRKPMPNNEYNEAEHQDLMQFRDSFNDAPDEVRSGYQDTWSGGISDMDALKTEHDDIAAHNESTQYNPFITSPEDERKMEEIRQLLTSKGEYEAAQPFNLDEAQRKNLLDLFSRTGGSASAYGMQVGTSSGSDGDDAHWQRGLSGIVTQNLLNAEGLNQNGNFYEPDRDEMGEVTGYKINHEKAKDYIRKVVDDDFNVDNLLPEELEAYAQHLKRQELTSENMGNVVKSVQRNFRGEQVDQAAEEAKSQLNLMFPPLDENKLSEIEKQARSLFPRNRGEGEIRPVDEMYYDIILSAKEIRDAGLSRIMEGWPDRNYQREIDEYMATQPGQNPVLPTKGEILHFLKNKYITEPDSGDIRSGAEATLKQYQIPNYIPGGP